MKVTYVGHATLLIEMAGVRLLTDPNFDPRLGRMLPRVSPPGIAVDQLPSLDGLLLTHAHADHLSFDSLDRLPSTIPLFAPPVVARWLNRLGYRNAEPIAADSAVEFGGLTIRAARATHRGSRYGFDRWRGAANMYLLDSGAESCFFAGDTALVPDTHVIVEQALWNEGRELGMALLPIGYAPWWKPGFRRGHLTHDDALALFERLRAHVLVPYHWGTFRHITAGAHDAIRRLRSSLLSHHLSERVKILEPGEALEFVNEISERQ